MLSQTLFSLSAIFAVAQCLSASEWRAQSVYQVMTDRFARTDGSTSAPTDQRPGVDLAHSKKSECLDSRWVKLPWVLGPGHIFSKHQLWFRCRLGILVRCLAQKRHGMDGDGSLGGTQLTVRQYLMVDIVTNHMGYAGCGNCVDYSTFNPFNKKSYYHPFCLIDYNNQTSMELCWEGDNTVSLPDLRVEDSSVQDMWATWIKQLVANYTIDGLRIDSAAEVSKASLKIFETAAYIYAIGEVFNNNADYVCSYQDSISGLMNYPMYYNITSAFASTSGDIKALEKGINTMKATCKDVTLLGSFLENHDNPRFPSLTADTSLAKNAIGFAMLADGIPIVYQGQEQHFSGASTPAQREQLWKSGYDKTAVLYKHIGKLNAIRTLAIKNDEGYLGYNAYPVWTDDHTIVMRKGNNDTQVIGVFNNLGAQGSANFTLLATSSGFDAGMEVTDVLACDKFTTDEKGDVEVKIVGGEPLVLYSTKQLEGSGIC
ncbi:putative alpha-amylase [Aureobasidium sp. EXF-10728]|nr:putative alpha-amylase [Aureobasidium sp. EXF-10728]